MGLAHDPQNYLYGKGRLYFKRTGETGYLDLGNVPSFELTPEIEEQEHFSSRSGVREKDLSFIVEKKLAASLTLEEFSAENINLAFGGDQIMKSVQNAGFLKQALTEIQQDRFMDLGKQNLSIVKIEHTEAENDGTPTPFVVGDTLTGETSAAEGTVGYVGTGYIEMYDVTGKFQTGEVISDGEVTPTEATILSVEKVSDLIVVDDSDTPTVRYTQGTDYDVDALGGMIRIREFEDNKDFAIICDYAEKSLKTIRPLVADKVEGELLFIGDPGQGPQTRVTCWKSKLTISGGVGMISDDLTSIPINVSVEADRVNHPTEPFMRVVLPG